MMILLCNPKRKLAVDIQRAEIKKQIHHNKILACIESCYRLEQLEHCANMVKLFDSRWNGELSSLQNSIYKRKWERLTA